MTRAPLVDRVTSRLDDLADRMVAAFIGSVPAYAHLPREALDGEIRQICLTNLRVLITGLREQRDPRDDELVGPAASAARRAEERVPLDQVLTAYLIGAQLTWDALADLAEPDETAQLTAAAAGILAYLRTITAVVSRAYLEEQEAVVGEERDARRQLTEALLTTGDASAALAERAGVTPSATYRAVAIRFGPTPDELAPDISSTVAGRRKVRRATEAVEALVGGPALTLFDAGGGAAVLDVADPEALHRALAEAIGGVVWVAISDPVTPPGLPSAWAHAREVRRLTAVLDRAPGVWRVQDLLLERTLAADPIAAAELAAVLDPLEDREDLLDTLEVWFAADFDRRAAATALTIHPNTLDYRLRRASALVGRDIGSAAGSQLVGAALLARRLQPPTGRSGT